MPTEFNKVKSGVTFTKAAQKQDLQSGDTIPEALGKLAKYMDVTDDALSNIQPILTFDSEPKYESLNPVTSGGLYDYIELQSPTYINTFSTESDLYNYSGNLTTNDYAFVGTGSGATYYMNVYQYKSEVIRDTIENIKTVPSGSNILKTLNEPALPSGNIQYKLDCYVTAVNNQSYGTSPVISVIFSDNTTAQVTVPNANKTHIVKTYSKTIKAIQFMNSGQASNGYTDFEDIQILTTAGWNKLSYRLYNPTWDANQLSAINSGITSTKVTNYDNHIANKSNPHEVTKSQVGLGNVGNFKAVSTEASQGLTSTEQSNARTNINAQESLPFNGTYNASTNKVATESTVTNAINALDVSSQGGAGKYISEISETNGKVSATPTTMDTSLSNSSTNNNCPTSKTVYDDQQRQDAALAEVENKGAKNLFKITAVSEIKQGVRFTVNSDGTVTVTRESAGTSNAFLTLGQFTGESGITYTLSGCPATGSDSTYYMYIGSTFRDYGSGVSREGGTERSIVIYVDKTYSPDNLVFKPMICTKAEWDISHTYVPYGKTNAELTSDTATLFMENTSQQTEINYAINTGAKNLLNVTASSGVLNTATIDIADDGSIHISGQPTSNGAYVISSGIDLVIPENAYILSIGAEAGDTKMTLSLRRKGTTQYVDLYHAESRIIPSGTYDRAHIYLYSDTDYDTTVYPMIRSAAITDQTYEPYALSNPVITPAAIKAVDEGAKNLIDVGEPRTTTLTEVTVTVNSDGTLNATTSSATAAERNFWLYDDKAHMPYGIKPGKTYCFYSNSGTGDFGIDVWNSTNGTSWDSHFVVNVGTFVIATIPAATVGLGIRMNIPKSKTLNNVKAYPMICTAEDWAVSQKFVPYAPTNRELYQEKISIEDAFGSGTQILTNGTADITKIGNFYCQDTATAATVTNAPWTDSGFFGFVRRSVLPSERFIQIAFKNNDTMSIAKRRYTGTWQPWAYSSSEPRSVGNYIMSYADSLPTPGVYFAYHIAGSGIDKPVAGHRYMYQIMMMSSTYGCIHAYELDTSSGAVMYIANKINGTWSSWYKFEGTVMA